MQLEIGAAVTLAKQQIIADVKAGTVPASVGSFRELHDHVDANDYGTPSDFNSADCEFWNAVQSQLDQWITSGEMQKDLAGC